ncbi:MAG: TadE/TadG family type IV pilus assembly protein [Hyphomicrobiaceae bacterium]
MVDLKKMIRIGSGFAQRFARDRKGVAAVEFAYIAPILLVMLMATFELSRAVSIDRRLNSVSAMASELVAREEQLDDADLKNIYRSLNHVMKPYDDNSLVVRLLQVRTDTNGATKVEWSTEINSTAIDDQSTGSLPHPYPQCSTFGIDPELKQNGSRVVVAEVGYNYQPIFGSFIFRDFSLEGLKQKRNDVEGLAGSWSSKAFHSPRWNCVAYQSANCQTCPE